MKMKKQLIGILLTLMMVLGLLPGMSRTARAEETATVNIYDLTGMLCDTKVFNIGDMFTTYTVFNAAEINNGRIRNVDGQQTYTDSVLALADELDTDRAIKNKTLVFPILGTDAIGNAGNSGEISFNASSLATYTFNSDDDVLIRTMYTVKAGGVANIRTKISDMSSADGNHIFDKWEIKADRFTSSITAVENYPLWIGGVQADENNCDKLTNNHWSYDPSTHILTLSGYSYSGTGYKYNSSNYAAIYYNGADALTVSLSDANSVTQSLNWAYDGDCAILIDSTAALTITGTGSLTAQVQDSWGGPAIRSSEAIVFSGGTVKGTGGSAGVKASGVTVKEGITSVDLKGSKDSAKAVDGTLINEMAGVGYNKWNQPTKIEADTTGATLSYQHVVFPIAQYTIVFDADGGTGSMDDVTVEEGESYELPSCGFDPPDGKKFNWWDVHGVDVIGIPGTSVVITSGCLDEDGVVPIKAKWIDVDKAPAATVKTAPEAEDLTYSGQGQALVTAGEAEGGTMWYAIGENETDVPDSGWNADIPEGTNAGSYYVWYRAVGDNSHRDSDAACCEAKINKAANPATVTGTASVMRGGNTVDLANNVALNGATGAVGYAISGEAHGCTVSDAGVLTSGTGEDAGYTGSVTVNVTVAEDANYFSLAATPIIVTITDKGAQTISAENVTVTYGDTGKSVSATVTDPATGGGAISYAVKEGSGDYIEVNASTGALTIKKVPADGKAYVTVTAAETAAYEQATKDITVTINKANAVAATVTANNRNYDGTEKPLVTVSGEATGGTMQYAIGTATEATEPYAASVPKATDAGTYYVWYMAVGDDNHSNSEPASVTVTISPVDKARLNSAIEAAETYYDSIKDDALFADIAATLKNAIDTAKAVAENDNVTAGEVEAQIAAVGAAVDTARKAAEAISKEEVDKAAAKAVTDAINALPAEAGVKDKDAVAAVRAAYDALTEDQKKLVDAETLAKLTTAEAQVKAAVEEAKRIKISKCTITAKPRIYTGKATVPKVTVMYGKTKLKEGQDYTLSYSKAKIYQKVKVTVKGKGKFKGSRNVYFKIIPKGTAITKATGGTKQFTVEWKKREGVTGYRVEYSLHEDFSRSRGLYVKGVDTLTATIRKPKAGRTYYVRVRTYVKRKNRLFFSAWSETVSTNRAKVNEAQVFEATMAPGEALDLKSLLPAEISGDGWTWETNDPAIATVSGDGVVTALQPGTVVVTMTGGEGERFVFTVEVEEALFDLELPEIELLPVEDELLPLEEEAFTGEIELELAMEE